MKRVILIVAGVGMAIFVGIWFLYPVDGRRYGVKEMEVGVKKSFVPLCEMKSGKGFGDPASFKREEPILDDGVNGNDKDKDKDKDTHFHDERIVWEPPEWEKDDEHPYGEDRVDERYLKGPKGEVYGRVIAEDTGRGVEGVYVNLMSPSTMPPPPHYVAQTDKDGFYRIRGVASATYEIRITYGEKNWDYIDMDVDGYVSVPPEEGVKVKVPDIVLEVGGELKVRVLKSDGTPMERERVESIVGYATYKEQIWSGYVPKIDMRIARREPDGTYLMKGVPPVDDLRVVVDLYGYPSTQVRGIKVEKQKITGPVDVIVNTNDPTGIEGVITDAETGKPIEGVRVIIGDGISRAETNKDGYYVIEGLTPDFYKFFVMHYKYRAISKTKKIEVKKGKKTIVNISMTPEGEPIPYDYGVDRIDDPELKICGQPGVTCEEFFKCDAIQIDNIDKSFNSAMATFQTCIPSLWSYMNTKEVKVYCKKCEGACPYAEGEMPGTQIWLYYREYKAGDEIIRTFITPYLDRTIFHESIHLVGKGDNDTYACQYACYGGYRCVPCGEQTVDECKVPLGVFAL